MCLIAFAIDADPACPLLIAANRDEFFDRPTAPLHRWTLPEGPTVVAGRDLRDGGTWLGASDAGRVAMLTNVRSAQPGPGQRSRGELATRWLRGDGDEAALLAHIDPAAYGGFNLVVGDFRRGVWAWLSNRHPERPHDDGAAALHHRRLPGGVYGLSNAALDTPWPKTERLKGALGASLRRMAATDEVCGWLPPLTEALADRQAAAAHELPLTGVPPEVESALSSPFVRMPERGYGTRSSVVLRVQPATTSPQTVAHAPRWQVQISEWTHAPGPAPDGPHAWAEQARRSETLVW